MTNAEAIKWLELQRSKGVQLDDYSEETYHIRVEAEKRISEAYFMAIDALREQGARVLTKEEAVHYMSDEEAYEFSEKAPLYVEHKTEDEWDFKWARAETVYAWMCDLRMRQNYGITFRLWTSRPTDEQRKAVAWDA